MLDNILAVATAKIISCNSAVATAELQDNENQIDIFHIFLLPTELLYVIKELAEGPEAPSPGQHPEFL